MKKIIEVNFYACYKPQRWRRMLRVMKIATAIILIAALHVSARGVAQKISFAGKNVPLTKVFNAIEDQLGYGVLMPHELLQDSRPVTVKVVDGSLDELLQQCFSFQPWKLNYSITGHTILISVIGSLSTPSTKTRILPKMIKIEGTVYNEAGQPLAGANITIKQLNKGTITDAKGEFTTPPIPVNSTLVISFIGYSPQTFVVRDQESIKVYLKLAKDELDKAVVQAYGETTRRLATGDIGTVRAEDIAKQPIMNPIEALQGQVAGVVVTNTSGYVSGTIKVEIRGRNTINPSFPADPLYIIDGVPLTILDLRGTDSYTTGQTGVIQAGIGSPAGGGQSPFYSINPADIESIEVLKDADATAIYGSRGSNGVILITTKKGKPGKTQFDLNAYSGYSQITKYYKMLNTQQYLEMRREALANDGLPVDINNAPDLVAWDTTRYTNWQKYMWGGLGKATDIQGSLSGGDTRTTFRIGAGYHNQTDVLTSSGANQRGSLSFNFNHKSLNQRFSITMTSSYSVVAGNMIFVPGSITMAPDAPPVFNKLGQLNFSGWAPLSGNLNTFGALLQPYTTQTTFLNSSLALSYELLKGLSVKTNFGYDNIQANQSTMMPIISQNPQFNPTGQSNFGSTLIHNLIIEPQVEYNTFLSKGKLNALLGTSYQANTTSSTNLLGTGYQNDALLTSVTNAPIQFSGNYFGEYKYEAVFSRINYNWDDRYIIDINARRDGSTKFGPGRQFGNFGSIGASWIFTDESPLKNKLSFLSFGKLRGSYGSTGGDQVPEYVYLSQWAFIQHAYNSQLPVIPQGHFDSTLHWQVNKKLEVAIDLAFLDNLLSVELAWYRNRCNDQLVPFPTPSFTGFGSVYSNSPADVQNAGWEVLLNGKIINNKQFSWTTKLNIGINRNKLLAYPNLDQSPYVGTLQVGKPLDIAKVLHYTGIDPQTGNYTFQDKNKDGQITIDFSGKTSDDSYFVDLTPKYDGGFTNNFMYKNWDLSVFFYFKKQLGRNVYSTTDAPGDATNQPTTVLDRWQTPGQKANAAKFTTNPGRWYVYYQSFSDAVFTDASFIRLQNFSLSYNLPKETLSRSGIRNIRIYVKGHNLFFISNYKGIDPEVQSFGLPPSPRTVTAGLNCNF